MADDYQDLGTITEKWMREPNWAKDISSEWAESKYFISYPGTAMSMGPLSDKVPKMLQYRFMNRTKAQELEFLNFLNAQKGRWKKFWIPTWIAHFELTEMAPNGVSHIHVKNTKFKMLWGGHERLHFFMTNGDHVTREITDVDETSESVETLWLTTALTRQINPEDVFFIGFYLLARLDIDEIEFRHHTSAVSEFDLSVIELVREYP